MRELAIPATLPLQPVSTPWLIEAGCELAILRLDQLDLQVSGNKLFKLQPYIERMQQQGLRGLISLGGAHSNHLHAMAAAAQRMGITAVGLVRGPAVDSQTMADVQRWGMQLHWLSREAYRARREAHFVEDWQRRHPDLQWVPEGGDGALGQQGAQAIWQVLHASLPALGWVSCDAVVCPVGTGTTWQGVARLASCPVWGMSAVPKHYLPPTLRADPCLILACRRGFAQSDTALAAFAAEFFAQTGVVLEPVYTAKALLALRYQLADGKFARGSRLVMLHTGGLQGIRATADWPVSAEVAA
ncbi:1-aminocyclopropane-1-carboxylate deaminase/D-cysteine desulfhydrase [Atopomonas sediminilitoris]|uniref:1-aminocyclopropane-1-carboxylate deaminase/D-cysteine desulfhydrase n=1 Tax=Atopomonas sediminilitoris TaxID=2919919 RepID=UPI001F4E3911|nr:pyridoxal-phosphate dependent enzyme [Atopomonas sediminilitoris]MCJ8167736.1 pyridoxal-phosphate dependent enzyme [Atopomonas sediminilitoris]